MSPMVLIINRPGAADATHQNHMTPSFFTKPDLYVAHNAQTQSPKARVIFITIGY